MSYIDTRDLAKRLDELEGLRDDVTTNREELADLLTNEDDQALIADAITDYQRAVSFYDEELHRGRPGGLPAVAVRQG